MSIIITSVFVMIAALLIRKAFSKKLSGRALMAIWAIVFIKLAVPVNIPAAFSVMNLFAEAPVLNVEEKYTTRTDYFADLGEIPLNFDTPEHNAPDTDTVKADDTFIEGKPTDTAVIKMSFWDVINTVYVIAAAVLTAGVFFAYAVCAVRFAAFEEISVPEKFAEKGVSFRKGNVGTPAVFGIFRPVILLSESANISDSAAFEHIILHEKTHIRHRDQLFNLLTLIICCLNWYDPLAWVCRALYLKDAEKWCDESVINLIGTANKKAYAESLLACAIERSSPFALVSGFGENDIKGRIRSIMYDKKFKRGASAAVAALTAVVLAAFGTGASASENKREFKEVAVPAAEVKDEPVKNYNNEESLYSGAYNEQNDELSPEEANTSEEVKDTSPPENFRLSELPEAEQIYSSLYNLAEFEHYMTFGLRGDIDTGKSVNVERIHFPAAGLPKEMIGTTYYETFYLIKRGRLSNGADFSAWLNTFATSKYIAKDFREWYKEKFTVSEEKIYVSEYTAEYIGTWLVTDNFTLENITATDDKTIRLDFSFVNYGIDIGSMPEKTENLTVVMKYEDGWKIYGYSEGYGMTALINELVINENPSGLREQIEKCLTNAA